jgi:hypothetical protein
MLGDWWRCGSKVSPKISLPICLDANFLPYRVKTDDKSASQHMEVKDGALNISFQAPQIIGWVSEVLPELPRGDKPKEGGLNGAPVRGFRANL